MSERDDTMLDQTVPGGRYEVRGRVVDAHGADLGPAPASSPPAAVVGTPATAGDPLPNQHGVPSAVEPDGTVIEDPAADDAAALAAAAAAGPASIPFDPGSMTLAELATALEDVTDPAEVRALAAYEAGPDGKQRAGAAAAFDARLAALGG